MFLDPRIPQAYLILKGLEALHSFARLRVPRNLNVALFGRPLGSRKAHGDHVEHEGLSLRALLLNLEWLCLSGALKESVKPLLVTPRLDGKDSTEQNEEDVLISLLPEGSEVIPERLKT